MTKAGLLVAALLASGCAHRLAARPAPDAHRVMLTLDAHLDTPVHFGRAGWSFGDRHDAATDLAHMDLPRMADGALDGGFFVIFML